MKLNVQKATEPDKLLIFFIGKPQEVQKLLFFLNLDVEAFWQGHFIVKVKPGTRGAWIKILEKLNDIDRIKEEEEGK